MGAYGKIGIVRDILLLSAMRMRTIYIPWNAKQKKIDKLKFALSHGFNILVDTTIVTQNEIFFCFGNDCDSE